MQNLPESEGENGYNLRKKPTPVPITRQPTIPKTIPEEKEPDIEPVAGPFSGPEVGFESEFKLAGPLAVPEVGLESEFKVAGPLAVSEVGFESEFKVPNQPDLNNITLLRLINPQKVGLPSSPIAGGNLGGKKAKTIPEKLPNSPPR